MAKKGKKSGLEGKKIKQEVKAQAPTVITLGLETLGESKVLWSTSK
jgi:hypothetical protein